MRAWLAWAEVHAGTPLCLRRAPRAKGLAQWCIGAMFALFLVAAIPPDAAHHVFQMLLSGIAHFFGGLPGLGKG